MSGQKFTDFFQIFFVFIVLVGFIIPINSAGASPRRAAVAPPLFPQQEVDASLGARSQRLFRVDLALCSWGEVDWLCTRLDAEAEREGGFSAPHCEASRADCLWSCHLALQ